MCEIEYLQILPLLLLLIGSKIKDWMDVLMFFNCDCTFFRFFLSSWIEHNIPGSWSVMKALGLHPYLGILCWSCWSLHYNPPHWSLPAASSSDVEQLVPCRWTTTQAAVLMYEEFVARGSICSYIYCWAQWCRRTNAFWIDMLWIFLASCTDSL